MSDLGELLGGIPDGKLAEIAAQLSGGVDEAKAVEILAAEGVEIDEGEARAILTSLMPRGEKLRGLVAEEVEMVAGGWDGDYLFYDCSGCVI